LQVDLVHVTHQHFNFAKQLPEGIYDIRDLKIARRDFMKHRCEQKEIIAADEGDFYRAVSREQFLQMDGGIDSAKATTENDNSFLAPLASYPNDH
jgi:hypothetical protein